MGKSHLGKKNSRYKKYVGNSECPDWIGVLREEIGVRY